MKFSSDDDNGELFITNKRNLAADLVSIVLGGAKEPCYEDEFDISFSYRIRCFVHSVTPPIILSIKKKKDIFSFGCALKKKKVTGALFFSDVVNL